MKRMLKVELFQFAASRSLWIIVGVLFLASGISVFTGVYESAEAALLSMSRDNMVPLLAAAIYGGLMLTEGFTNGTVRRCVANGGRRAAVLLAKFLHYLLGCAILLLLNLALPVGLAVIVRGAGISITALIQALLWEFLRSFPLYCALFGLFFLFAVLVQKSAAAIAVSVPASILLVVLTNRIYSISPAAQPLLQYSPIIQLQSAAAGGAVTEEYLPTVFLSLLAMVCFLILGIVKFDRDEL